MMTEQQYVEHEVQIRVLKEMADSRYISFIEKVDGIASRFDGIQKSNDVKFAGIEKELLRIDTKINWVLGVSVSGIFLPVFLKIIGVL